MKYKSPITGAVSSSLISICLGTNDLSKGDGQKERKPFNPEKFISTYIHFVTQLFEINPKAKLALLTSPILSDVDNKLLMECLEKIKSKFDDTHTVAIFDFKRMQPKGCDAHPDLEDHKKMAEQLAPFFDKLLQK